jgi:hypothetical protein
VEGRQRRLALGVLAAVLVAARTWPAVAEGEAAGSLVLAGQTVVLRYAYASARPGFFDKSKEDVRVLLSDVLLSESARDDVFELSHLGRDDRGHVLEVTIDAEGQPIGGAIYARAFDGMVSMAGMHRFERARFERALVAGRLFTEGVHEFSGVSFAYDATFSAVIPRPPTAEEVAAAIDSPPGRVATAWLAAIRAGRLPTILELLAPEAAAPWRAADAPARLTRARKEMPPDNRVVGLSRPTPETAVATVNGTRASDGVTVESTVALILVGGVWKVSE